ncbi:MAG: T9SS type A sorting domain-containing protein [Bacteroidia bacterium]|nr:T9SS type A sorting domain-containing protein [Bacteroidia bacterium]
MINKLVISRTALFIISFLISYDITSQTSSPFTSPPVNFSGSYSSGTQNNNACNATLNTGNISNAANYTIKAQHYISMQPGSSMTNFSTGSFAAYIESSPIEVVSYHASGFNNIPLYDKFELGLKLPQGLTDSINKFFGDTNYVGTTKYSCINGYGNAFKENYINPYDPEKISVEATFSFPGKSPQTIYGFYYREYSYAFANGSTVSYLNTNWVENTNLQYHWRVRFAPRYIGTYTVTWKIKTNNGILRYEDNVGQTFSTITSNSKGFLKLGVNGKFLVTQPDPSQPQKTILPIGIVEGVPQEGISVDNPVGLEEDNIPVGDAQAWGSNWFNFAYPSRFYKHRKKIREQIANQGANFVRIWNNYYGYDFEWEKAGVYDADPKKPLGGGILNTANPPAQNYKGVNRQAILWEFDSLVEMAKNKNLYIQWVLDDKENGFIAVPESGGTNTWDTKNPYRDILITARDPSSIKQYFTDPNAKKMAKKKLRYMIARYGYATSIAAFEMFNEFHFLNDQIVGASALNTYFKPWLAEMIDYIKNPATLNHRDHLYTASYEAKYPTNCNPCIFDTSLAGNNVGSIPDLDFFSTHPYNYNTQPTFSAAYGNTNLFRTYYSKPCQAGEMGLLADWGCIGSLKMPEFKRNFPEFMAPTFHTLLWSTTFIGGVTSGLEMWGRMGLKIDPTSQSYHNCGDGFIQHFKPLQAFIKDIDFDAGNYVPRHLDMEQMGAKLEAFYLIDNNGYQADHIVGYVRNKTFWWTNFNDPSSGLPYYNTIYPNQLKNEYDSLYLTVPPGSGCPNPPVSPLNLTAGQDAKPIISGWLGALHIYGLKNNTFYTVDWYDTYKENTLISSSNVLLGSSGPLVVIPPNFTGCTGQEYGFKIHPFGQARMASSTNSLLSIAESEMQIAGNDIMIYPNPASDKVFIKYDAEVFKDVTLALYDLSGRLILKQNSTKELSTANLENGAYLVKFSSDNFFKTFKINVMH